tara:strand:- start:814 stop:1200 length:387 start_codon:yes stop_codon:yes gene_type:complete
MRALSNKVKKTNSSVKPPRSKFIIGGSECVFEPAASLVGFTAAKTQNLLSHEMSTIATTEGYSLKVLFEVENGDENVKNEIKFMGFITAVEAKHELDQDSIAGIKEYIEHPDEHIVKAITASELVDMF